MNESINWEIVKSHRNNYLKALDLPGRIFFQILWVNGIRFMLCCFNHIEKTHTTEIREKTLNKLEGNDLSDLE